MDVAKRQDLPPSAGYKPIHYKRVPAKTLLGGWALIGCYLGMTAGAAFVHYLTSKKVHREEIEERSAQFAILPLLLAERDRAYLKQLRINRDEERCLMADVEGWKVGTWYGEPIYKLNTDDTLVEPRMQEYYIHANYRDYSKRAHLAMMS